MNKVKKVIPVLFAAAMIVIAAVWFMNDDLEHIEDTNGADDYSLQTITDDNLINLDMGALNYKLSTGILNDGVTVSSDQFTGVAQLMTTNFVLPSDFDMEVAGFEVKSGNFKMAVINEDEIVAVVEPDTFASCYLEDVEGTVSVVIAGESAEFTFSLDRTFCERYDITVGE